MASGRMPRPTRPTNIAVESTPSPYETTLHTISHLPRLDFARLLAPVQRRPHVGQRKLPPEGEARPLLHGDVPVQQFAVVLACEQEGVSRGEDAEHAREPGHAVAVSGVRPRA